MSQLSTLPLQQDKLFIYHSGVFAVRLDEDAKFFLRASPDMIANMLCNDYGYFASDTALFWRAQLAHYGLPSTSDTRDAKSLLQHAIHCQLTGALCHRSTRAKHRHIEGVGIMT